MWVETENGNLWNLNSIAYIGYIKLADDIYHVTLQSDPFDSSHQYIIKRCKSENEAKVTMSMIRNAISSNQKIIIRV